MRAIGPYVVVRELGRGTMGVVFEARHQETGGVVALKVFAGEAATLEARRRFEREAALAASLDHPGIVRVLDSGVHDGRPYFALELVRGRTLRERLHEGPLDEVEAATLARDLASALAHAHERGVLHRDVKPANILLDGERARLTDFGLARPLDARTRLTATGEVLGTPLYMAPEQAQDSVRAGPAADVYGVGAILYEALAGQPPIQGGNAMEVLEQIVRASPPPLRQLRPDVDRELALLVEGLLRKDPAKRDPADAATLAARLEDWLELHRDDGRPRASATLRVAAFVLAAGSVLLAVLIVLAVRGRPPASTGAPPPVATARTPGRPAPAPAPPANPPPALREVDDALEAGDELHALELLDQIARVASSATAECARGDVLLRRGDHRGALVAYERALALDPYDGAAALGRARARGLGGAPEDARADLAKARDLLRDSPWGRQAERALAVLGDADAALARFALASAGPERSMNGTDLAFLVGALTGERPEVEAKARDELEALGARFREQLAAAGSPRGRGAARKLFEVLLAARFGPCEPEEYAEPRTSSFAWVIVNRRGIPGTLGVLASEVARLGGLRLSVVCYPGRVLVRCDDETGPAIFDAYDQFRFVGDDPEQAHDKKYRGVPPRAVAFRLVGYLQGKLGAARDLAGVERCGRFIAVLADPGREMDELMDWAFPP